MDEIDLLILFIHSPLSSCEAVNDCPGPGNTV
jgi:hypothetical protein